MTIRARLSLVGPYMVMMVGIIFILAFFLPAKSDAFTVTWGIPSHDIFVDGSPISDGTTVQPIAGGTRTINLTGVMTYTLEPSPVPAPIAYLHRSGVGSGPCTADPTDCIPSENGVGAAECDHAIINSSSSSFDCEFTIYYFADSTTVTTSPTEDWRTENWQIYIKVGGSFTAEDETSNFEYGGSTGVSIPSSIPLGAWTPGGGPSATVTLPIENVGNRRQDAKVLGQADFTCQPGSVTVPMGDLHFDRLNDPYASMYVLSTTERVLTAWNVAKATQIGVPATRDMYFAFDTSTVLKAGNCTIPSLRIQGQVG